jgi:DNA polymerase-1
MPPEGYLLTEFDFAGQEFRWMAVASRDETMLSLCAPGEDAHGFMGAQIARRDYRELVAANKAGDAYAALDRKCGKFCNLSYQYRVSARTATVKARVEYEMDVDEHFIQDTQVIYKTSYPGVEQYWRSQIQTCKHQGYAETFAGRRVQLVDNWKGKNSWAMESTSINYPIQGTGGDQKYLALAVARNLLPEFGGYFYYELHDGLFFIFPEDKAMAASRVFLERLSNLPYKQAWGVDLPIQFPVDGKIGRSWGDLKDLDKWEK